MTWATVRLSIVLIPPRSKNTRYSSIKNFKGLMRIGRSNADERGQATSLVSRAHPGKGGSVKRNVMVNYVRNLLHRPQTCDTIWL